MTFLISMNPATGLIDPSAARDLGADLQARYLAAEPFPHVIIDDFLPSEIASSCLAEFDCRQREAHKEYNRAQERLKREYKPEKLSPSVRHLFYSFNSRPFIEILENIVGIKGLIPDPYFRGGGFHEIDNGGHLSVHTDFNHHQALDLERRVNVLIYLNEDWQAEYGGCLELWDKAMSVRVQSIVPVFNRCVIFNTAIPSNHGHPEPINHPAGKSRKSIALYYYTATWDGETKRSRTTQFRVRPGSTDKTDWTAKAIELVKDIAPPFAIRLAKRAQAAIKGSA